MLPRASFGCLGTADRRVPRTRHLTALKDRRRRRVPTVHAPGGEGSNAGAEPSPTRGARSDELRTLGCRPSRRRPQGPDRSPSAKRPGAAEVRGRTSSHHHAAGAGARIRRRDLRAAELRPETADAARARHGRSAAAGDASRCRAHPGSRSHASAGSRRRGSASRRAADRHAACGAPPLEGIGRGARARRPDAACRAAIRTFRRGAPSTCGRRCGSRGIRAQTGRPYHQAAWASGWRARPAGRRRGDHWHRTRTARDHAGAGEPDGRSGRFLDLAVNPSSRRDVVNHSTA